jgi:hypothetical protein
VSVRSVWVSMGGELKKDEAGEEVEKVVGVQGNVGRNASTDKTIMCKKLVRKYKSCEEDMNWASRGLVGTVINGDSIPLIQKRVEDAGFQDIDIIPLGAEKVFIHSLFGHNVSSIVGKAKEFFNLIFSSLVGWDKAVMPFQGEHGCVCMGYRYMLGTKASLSYVFLTVEGT